VGSLQCCWIVLLLFVLAWHWLRSVVGLYWQKSFVGQFQEVYFTNKTMYAANKMVPSLDNMDQVCVAFGDSVPTVASAGCVRVLPPFVLPVSPVCSCYSVYVFVLRALSILFVWFKHHTLALLHCETNSWGVTFSPTSAPVFVGQVSRRSRILETVSLALSTCQLRVWVWMWVAGAGVVSVSQMTPGTSRLGW
jgi:hypothetical protein